MTSTTVSLPPLTALFAPSFLRLLVFLGAGCWAACGAAAPRAYVAELLDGSIVRGDRLEGLTASPPRPQLSGKLLVDGDLPARWLRDESLPASTSSEAVVEMLTGDVLPGHVIAYRTGEESPFAKYPPHLVVEPAVEINSAQKDKLLHCRVVLRYVRRIVWQRRGEEYVPSTLVHRDGRRISYRGLRWETYAVRLLLDQGILNVPLDEIAELHLPAADFWDAWLDQLAALTPSGQGRLLTLQTTTGLKATISTDRFRGIVVPSNLSRASLLVQPAWSLDGMWMDELVVRAWSFLTPHEVRLSAVAPQRVREQSPFRGGWHWRVGTNVRGGPLRSGGHEFAWGLGVLADAELEFPLPALTRSIRVKIGLDQDVGAGGCARGRLLDAGGRVLYQSPLLVGSDQVVDSGAVSLIDTDEKPKAVVLVADSAANETPPGGDPLNIRDQLNWLEPLVELDPEQLTRDVVQRASRAFPAWEGWTIEPADGIGLPTAEIASIDQYRKHFLTVVLPRAEEFTLRRTLQVPPGRHWLSIVATHMKATARAGWIDVSIDGQLQKEFAIPERKHWGLPNPLVVPLEPFAGREIDVAITHRGSGKESGVEWAAIAICDQDPLEMLRPPQATDIEVVDLKSYQVSLTWPRPSDRAITHFRNYRGDREGFEPTQGKILSSAYLSRILLTDPDPPAGQTVWYAIVSVDALLRTSVPKYVRVDVPSNTPPENKLAVSYWPIDRGAVLCWEGTLDPDVAGFDIWRGPAESSGAESLEKIASLVNPQARHWVDAGLSPGKYQYAVAVRDRGGLTSRDNRPVAAAVPKFVRRINCGGEQVEAPPGVLWTSDRGQSSSSSLYTSRRSVKYVGPLAAVYHTERWSYRTFEYTLDVPPGTYELVLHLAETNPSFFKPEARKFDVFVNSQVAFKGLDVAAKVGPDTALPLRTQVRVPGQRLTIEFRAAPTGPAIKGLEILSLTE